MSKTLPQNERVSNSTKAFYDKFAKRLDMRSPTAEKEEPASAENTQEETPLSEKKKNKPPKKIVMSFSFDEDTSNKIRIISYMTRKPASELVEDLLRTELIEKYQKVIEEYYKLPEAENGIPSMRRR